MDAEFSVVGYWGCDEITDLVEQHFGFRPEVSTREGVVIIHPVPQELTDTQKAQIAVYLQNHPQGTSDEREAERIATETDLKDRVKEMAQSTVGVAVNDLTALQTKLLMAILLWGAGAISEDMKIKPLKDWA